MRKSSRKGFTLIELLVVIAIIAILAAILFPVFARARAKARQTKCQANLKNLGLALEMYSQDYDECLPLWGHGDTSSPDNGPAEGFYSWDTVIYPYMRNQQILFCPDNPYGRHARGYAMTRYTGDPFGNQTPCYTGEVPAPSSTVTLTEKGNQPPGINGDSAAESFYQSRGATNAAGGVEKKMFHNNGKNLLFLDGHVKWFAQGSGPFGQLNNYMGQACPLTGGGEHSAYEPHEAGHCEFWPDWPGL